MSVAARTVLQRPAREPGKTKLWKGDSAALEGHGSPGALRKPFGWPIVAVIVQRGLPPSKDSWAYAQQRLRLDVGCRLRRHTKHHSSEGNSGFSRLQGKKRKNLTPREQGKHERQQDAEEDGSHDGKVDRGVLASPEDVARQMEGTNAKSRSYQDEHAQGGEPEAGDDQELTEAHCTPDATRRRKQEGSTAQRQRNEPAMKSNPDGLSHVVSSS